MCFAQLAYRWFKLLVLKGGKHIAISRELGYSETRWQDIALWEITTLHDQSYMSEGARRLASLSVRRLCFSGSVNVYFPIPVTNTESRDGYRSFTWIICSTLSFSIMYCAGSLTMSSYSALCIRLDSKSILTSSTNFWKSGFWSHNLLIVSQSSAPLIRAG